MTFPLSLEQDTVARNQGLRALWVNLDVRIHGPLDLGCLSEAFARLVAHHDALRLRFIRGPEGEVQELGPEQSRWDLEVVALQDETELARESVRFQLLELDLESGGPLRVQVCRLSENDHVLFVKVHHLVMDRWAAVLFQQQLWESYFALAEGRQPDLPATTSVRELVAEQQRAGSALTPGQRRYWAKTLDGVAPIALPLPGEAGHAPFLSNTAGTAFVSLPPDCTSNLADMCAAAQVTPPALISAAACAALFAETGNHDLTVSVLWSGRETRARRRLVGCLTRLIPVRLSIDQHSVFTETARTMMRLITQGVMYSKPPYAHRRMLLELAQEGVKGARCAYERWYGGDEAAGTELILNIANLPNAGLPEAGTRSLTIDPYIASPASWTAEDRAQIDFGKLVVLAGVVSESVHVGSYFDPRYVSELAVTRISGRFNEILLKCTEQNAGAAIADLLAETS